MNMAENDNLTEHFNKWLLIEDFVNPAHKIKGWINETNFSNLYKEDWDVLMELVRKITTNTKFQNDYPDNSLFWDAYNSISKEDTFDACVSFLQWLKKNNYPFNEGDDYFTIENGKIIKSCWDAVSEELHDENPSKKYYSTFEKANEALNVKTEEVKFYTITQANFLEWYFNTGEDGSQKDMRTNLGKKAIDCLFEGKVFTFSVFDAFDECEKGCIPIKYLEEFGKDEKLGNDDTLEVMDLPFECEISLLTN